MVRSDQFCVNGSGNAGGGGCALIILNKARKVCAVGAGFERRNGIDAERNNAIPQFGYVSEGEACFVNSTQVTGTVPLHRLFHATTGEHFYTTSNAERDNAIQHLGFSSEGEACFVDSSDPSGRTPLYRLYKTI